jgi:outer membrane protein OmpA-like peptidoglycan-associated protein
VSGKIEISRFATCLAAALVAACATTPQVSPEVNEARARIATLAQSPLADQAAKQDLGAARSALAQAEQALEKGEDEEIVAHLAYLAERRAEIGIERVQEAEARQKIEKAESERDAVLLQARTTEARTAEAAAQASEQSALQSRAELEELERQYQALAAKKTERGMVLTLGDVLFDTDKATLKPGAMSEIERLANFLKQNPETRVRIEGHTDSVGEEAYNEELSRERAQAVANALGGLGVSSERTEIVAKGEGFPVVSNSTSAGRQQNRRVEIVFSDPAGSFATEPQAISSVRPE